MPQYYKIKTTAQNSFFGYPEIGLYINQELYDKYKDGGGGIIFTGTFSGYPSADIIGHYLLDTGNIWKLRKIYYNTFIEKQITSVTPLSRSIEILGKPVYKYSASEYDSNVLYNGHNYGKITCFDPTIPSPLPSGYRWNSSITLGESSGSYYAYFGGYSCIANMGSNTAGYTDSAIQYTFNVFQDNIIDENGQINIQDKALRVVISITDDNFSSGQSTLTINIAGTENVAQITNASLFNGVVPTEDTTDPYNEGGTTDQGGGNGTFDDSTDLIDLPPIPSITALDTGFITMYSPTKAQMNDLFNYLWTGAFDPASFKKIFANPIDAIMGFGIIPLNPSISGASEVKVGNISTGIYMNKIDSQIYTIDCGSVELPERYGSYLDYEPYCAYDLFLPFIGSIRISSDDIKKHKPEIPAGHDAGYIQVKYRIDILSGSCVAYIICNGTVAYQYNGNVLTQLPITGNDFTSMYQGVLSIAGNLIGSATSFVSGNAGAVLGNVANVGSNVMGSKPSINRSGSISGSYGYLGEQKPFLIANVPNQAVATWQNAYEGYPAHITKKVGDVSGYSEWEKIYFNNIPATDGELKEIENLLYTGVVL